MKQLRHPDQVKYPHCPVCGHPVAFNKRRTNYYCSAACKQKAYRARHHPPISKDEHYRKIIETKRSHAVKVMCGECAKEFTVDQTRSATLYCSAACKQAAYRKRREKIDAERFRLTDRYRLLMSDLNDVFDQAAEDYRKKWGLSWRFLNAILANGQDGGFSLYEDGKLLFRFPHKPAVVEFLAHFVAAKRVDRSLLLKDEDESMQGGDDGEK